MIRITYLMSSDYFGKLHDDYINFLCVENLPHNIISFWDATVNLMIYFY